MTADLTVKLTAPTLTGQIEEARRAIDRWLATLPNRKVARDSLTMVSFRPLVYRAELRPRVNQ